MKFALAFQGLSKKEVDVLWQPFRDWLAKHNQNYQLTLSSVPRPVQQYWDLDYLIRNQPAVINVNQSKNATPGEFWWASNQAEVSMYINYYLSMYLPFKLFEKENAARLAKTLYAASRLAALTLHFNKGLSGASTDAIKRQKNTAMNPEVLDAAALVIIADSQRNRYSNVKSYQPNLIKASEVSKKANQAMALIHALSPKSGTYPNEADYFIKNWQVNLWSNNYPKLLRIKHKYDPQNLFTCHHCVGSDT
ncbi:Berberine and berberine like protein [Legionella massiliensis]|uniref:Berberine and berberine like protein n=1 Tax=Legionella massiliensis TaxID=1034943 RepID=A0A078KTR1_9GAMM|nr:BBE domain-containing protein [Legionella massiliensis]CDZ76352.1 Berberine and berberine like protein [Legionella massiliensis]CEE12090.1 Berberine and berberine like protein [Legionella massiliensis]